MKNKITIKDIARLANVSKSTISFYLNGNFDKMSAETKERIAKVIAENNYQPSVIARSLKKNTKLIGVIIGNITNSFSNQIVNGIDDCALECGYQLIVGSSNFKPSSEAQYFNGMKNMGVDGFIIQPTVDFDESLIDHSHIVFIDSPNRNTKGMWVKTNNYEAVMDITESLVLKGYDSYILVSGDPNVLATRMERYRGFVDVINRHHKDFHIIIDNKGNVEYLKREFAKYIDKSKKTLIFACSNWLLSSAYVALKDYIRLIPDNLGLIGFDSLEWTNLVTPKITTIVQPAYEEGYKACKILIDKIEGMNQEPPNQIFNCYLNEGESIK